MPDMTVVEPFPQAKPEASSEEIANERFIHQLDELRELKEFLFEEKVQFKPEDLQNIHLQNLNNLSYSSSGRCPNDIEWQKLDEKLATLTSYLSQDMRLKIRLGELGIFFKTLPIIFLISSVLSTILYINLPYMLGETSPWRLLLWLTIMSIWSISQGGLGACAFLGTSVVMKTSIFHSKLSQENIDLTDRNFLFIRVILGTLFALILGLPYSPLGLNVIDELNFAGQTVPNESHLLLGLVPFLAGFSTHLVLIILGKFVIAFEAVFGRA
jgi:hypothetical protein